MVNTLHTSMVFHKTNKTREHMAENSRKALLAKKQKQRTFRANISFIIN